jgi:plastocyanin
MRHLLYATLAVAAALFFFQSEAVHAGAAASTGSIVGHIKLTGASPGNPLIRMGVDPQCASLNSGSRPIQAIVVRSAEGGLANALVDLEKTLPGSKTSPQPVTIDQQKCVYTPRVVGARVGQTLRIKNDDPVFHNVHSSSTAGNDFNFSQPSAGMVREIALKGPDVMLHLKCDVHSWMTAYIAVEPHQYFAVSGQDGSFVIPDVPAGRHTVRVWHERFGELTQMVTVAAGQKATADFAYTGQEKASRARIQEVTVPGDVAELRLGAIPSL